MQHKDAPRAVGVTLDASTERFVDGELNLWTGFRHQPEKGEWPRLREHIETVICTKPEEAAYVLKWCAWTLQNPVRASEVAVVMKGGKGAGKGVVGNLLKNIFGAHGLQISSAKHLVGHFNAHLMHTCLLFSDEALWAGDKAAEGTFKRLVTEKTLTVEPKGLDAFEAPNRLSIIMASNEDWVVPASTDERRFAVFNVSNNRQGDHAYFDALHRELYQDGGAEAFVHDMLAMELGDWHPRFDIPQTEGLKEQQQESADPATHWLWALLEDGKLPGMVSGWGNAAQLFAQAVRSHVGLRYWTRPKMRKLLEGIGCTSRKKEDGAYWVFPPLPEARANFRKLYPSFMAFTDEETAEWNNANWVQVE